MARKGWNALSANYRARLEKKGITKKDYEQGTSIVAARGHAHTPERPSQANPQKHQVYVQERTRLTARVTSLKNDFFNTSPKWNPVREVARYQKNPPPMKLLRMFAKLTKAEWLDAIRETPEWREWLGYH